MIPTILQPERVRHAVCRVCQCVIRLIDEIRDNGDNGERYNQSYPRPNGRHITLLPYYLLRRMIVEPLLNGITNGLEVPTDELAGDTSVFTG